MSQAPWLRRPESTPTRCKRAIAAFNDTARGETADAFWRAKFSLAPLQPPFGIVKVKPGLFHT